MTDQDIKNILLPELEKLGPKKKVLVIPPDYTRYHSYAGRITEWIWEYYGDSVKAILPALGNHSPMKERQIGHMFGKVPQELFINHDWRNDVVTLGHVPAEFVFEVSEGRLNFTWPVQVNKLLIEEDWDLILSVGQVVPHEVVGMANHNKNIFVGTGGPEGINKSHYVGAVYGMERMMGRADTPVRRIFDYASEHFGRDLPVYYVLTVVGSDGNRGNTVKGLFCGSGKDCFLEASDLALETNFTMLEEPLNKVVVYLDPDEFKSTWLGNKSIYRTRMAMADGGELIVLAPGLVEFGEDSEIDVLIRKYGYRTTPEILEFVDNNEDLRNNLSAAAHLIHGTSEGRFTIRYCPGKGPENLSRKEIETAGFEWGNIDEYLDKYSVSELKDGFNRDRDGEEFFFISNPALGLWTSKERFG